MRVLRRRSERSEKIILGVGPDLFERNHASINPMALGRAGTRMGTHVWLVKNRGLATR